MNDILISINPFKFVEKTFEEKAQKKIMIQLKKPRTNWKKQNPHLWN